MPEAVRLAYGGEIFEFGPEYLIPKPFDPRVLFYVAPAIAQAAMESGVARITVDLDEYRDRLRASLGPGHEVMRQMANRARRDRKRVVLADVYSAREIRAAVELREEGILDPILIGRREMIEAIAAEHGLSIAGIESVYPSDEEAMRYRYAEVLFERRSRKGLTRAEARAMMFHPIPYGAMMVLTGDADAMVAGLDSHYPEAARPVLRVLGRREGVDKVAGVHMVALPHRELLFFADTTVNIDPDAETLAETAVLVADYVKSLGITPRVAMLSFSNFGSAPHPESKKMRRAVELVQERSPGLEIDGEMQADTALDIGIVRDTYPFSDLTGPANILIFPTLSAANTAYKLILELGGAEIIGPLLLGISHPVHVLQRGSTVDDVIHLATLAAVDAQGRT